MPVVVIDPTISYCSSYYLLSVSFPTPTTTALMLTLLLRYACIAGVTLVSLPRLCIITHAHTMYIVISFAYVWISNSGFRPPTILSRPTMILFLPATSWFRTNGHRTSMVSAHTNRIVHSVSRLPTCPQTFADNNPCDINTLHISATTVADCLCRVPSVLHVCPTSCRKWHGQGVVLSDSVHPCKVCSM